MKSEKNVSRRLFLKQSGALTSVAFIPQLWTLNEQFPLAPRKLGPNDKVNLALCGIGFQGGDISKRFFQSGLCNVVALCDVDMGAPHTQELIKMFPDAPRFQDFRKMFDKMGSQIDAVTAGVPDFSHFSIAMLAMSLGKHVYSEKPMAHTFNECELMMKAEKKYGVVTQMGNQGHSEGNYFQFKAWKEAGIIKDVTAVTAHMNSSRRWHNFPASYQNGFPPKEAIPPTMDWDTWLGTEQFHDYCKDFVNGQWRCWYDFGMGALGDWGAHIIDTIHEFLDLGLPFEINMKRADQHNPYFYPLSSTIEFKFPERDQMPPLTITWYDGINNIPPVPAGYGNVPLDPNIPPPSNGVIQPSKLNPGKIIYSKELTFKGGSHGSTLSIIPEEKAKEMASKLPEVPKSPSNHYANFLLSCRGDEKPRSPFSIAGPLSQVFCLGVIAQRLNAELKFDRKKKKITNNKIADQLLVGPAPRKEWEQFYKL